MKNILRAIIITALFLAIPVRAQEVGVPKTPTQMSTEAGGQTGGQLPSGQQLKLTSLRQVLQDLIASVSFTSNLSTGLCPHGQNGVIVCTPLPGGLTIPSATLPSASMSGITITDLTGFVFANGSSPAQAYTVVPSTKLPTGISVTDPGTGLLESVLPIQTQTGASYTGGTGGASWLQKITRRSNSGSAMTDTFPAAATAGMANGAIIQIHNFDATATDTITAGTGTTINGGATATVGALRQARWVLDTTVNPPNWSPDDNTLSSLLISNNLSDLANPATAIANLFGTHSANTIFAGPASGIAATPGFRALVAADLPLPTLSSIGGIEAIGAVSHQWVDSISTGGVPHLSQPAYADISGLSTAAQASTGTSGHVLGFLDGGNTYSGADTFSNSLTVSGSLFIPNGSGGTKCLHSDATGLVGLATADCGSGSGGGVIDKQDFCAPGVTGCAGGGTFTPGTTTSITLLNAPSLGTNLAVYFDGVWQNQTTWSLSGTTLTFNAAPPLGTKILEIVSGIPVSTPGVASLNGLTGILSIADNGGGTVNASGTTVTLGSPGGWLNLFRNGPNTIWQRGTTGLTTSTTITNAPSYTADGWIAYSFGAAATCKQAAGHGGAAFSLECDGVASNTDIIVGQRIESTVAAPAAGNQVTAQFWYWQNSGSSQTPKIASCYATVADTWNGGTNKFNCANNSGATADLAPTSSTWPACATATWCHYAISFPASANAGNGYEIDLDCNAAFTSSSVGCRFTAEDVRVTYGVATGAVANPPPPELRPLPSEFALCQFYLRYVPVTGMGIAESATQFDVTIGWPQMRSVPAITQVAPLTISNITSADFTQSGVGFTIIDVAGAAADGVHLRFSNFSGLTGGNAYVAGRNTALHLQLSSEL